MDDRRRVFDVLARCQLYRDFQMAFENATGIAIRFEPFERFITMQWDRGPGPLFLTRELPPHIGNENHLILIDWLGGIYEVLVPVCAGERVLGLLRTGCLVEKPLHKQQSGITLSVSAAARDGEQAVVFANIPTVSRAKAKALGKMLCIFAEYLGRLSNELMLHQANCEPAIISRAKQYIQLHHREDVALNEVAAYARVSSFYLCKLFKRVTGLNFSNFLMRTRLETAKELLLNSSRRINEVALDAGFQSLTHFNRMFKQVIGESPRKFREHCAATARPV